jgi:hypothetical protein
MTIRAKVAAALLVVASLSGQQTVLTESFTLPSWSAVSAPAVSTLASASRAAGGVGVRHIAQCVHFSAAATTAPVLTRLTVILRDGATGAGAILWQATVAVPAATGQSIQPHSICGLNVPGSMNTAMTLEFSALLTNLFENVALTGYDKGF